MSNLPQAEQTAIPEVLFRCQTIFPFTFFPTTLELTETSLSIQRLLFFFSHRITFILVKDIVKVSVNQTPFFAGITLEIRHAQRNPQPIRFLKPGDAATLEKRIIGLLETDRLGIKTESLSLAQKIKTVEQLGEKVQYQEGSFNI